MMIKMGDQFQDWLLAIGAGDLLTPAIGLQQILRCSAKRLTEKID